MATSYPGSGLPEVPDLQPLRIAGLLHVATPASDMPYICKHVVVDPQPEISCAICHLPFHALCKSVLPALGPTVDFPLAQFPQHFGPPTKCWGLSS